VKTSSYLLGIGWRRYDPSRGLAGAAHILQIDDAPQESGHQRAANAGAGKPTAAGRMTEYSQSFLP
jgi:hypothetical protein